MKLYINLFFAFAALFLLSSCEDIIEIDLSDAKERIIIEGTVNSSTEVAHVLITRSNGFYDSTELEKITGAIVYLETESGLRYDFLEGTEGDYSQDNIQIVPGENYVLKIEIGNDIYIAETIAPYAAQLDSLSVSEFNSPFGGADETLFQIIANWNDPANVNNYYRIRAYINDTLSSRELSLSSDDFSDGGVMRDPVREQFEEGDHAKIELLSIDKNYYDYFLELSALESGGLNSTTPFNPMGNFDNDALGYFGIYSTSFLEVQL